MITNDKSCAGMQAEFLSCLESLNTFLKNEDTQIQFC